MTAIRLKWLTKELLEPVWSRRDVRTEDIARALNVTRAAISFRAKTFGLPSRAGNQLPAKKAPDDLFREMWVAGVSSGDMARYFGFAGRSSVTARRRLMGLEPRVRSIEGVSNRSQGYWVETISIDEFWQMKLGDRMRAEAAKQVGGRGK